MKVFVLGASGMIGNYVCHYIKGSVGVLRSQVNALHIRKELFFKEMITLGAKEGDVIINTIGITNKHTDNFMDFIVVNSLFPRLLADYCEEHSINMIHLSTDCVFSGEKGQYSEYDDHDDQNIYGISKSAGEPRNCSIIRTSIIAENKNNSKDLLEWVRKTKNGVLYGYTHHFWNGITGLQFAKICKEIIDKNIFWRGVVHIFSPDSISKHDLIQIISDVYELNNTIKDSASRTKHNETPHCDRTLISVHKIKFNIPPIREQLIELKNYKWT